MRAEQNSDKKKNRGNSMRWRSGLGAFIPRHIPNRLVCGAMSLLSVMHRTSKKKCEENRKSNLMALRSGEAKKAPGKSKLTTELYQAVGGVLFTPGNYIENQQQWKNVRFGNRSTMAYSGCEILAVYNGLLALGECINEERLVDLISIFERKGAVWAGLFGTTPGAIRKYFEKQGYHVDMSYARRQNVINALGQKADTVLVMVYNDAYDIFQMIHTVNISKDTMGKFYAHNCYKLDANRQYISDGPFDTLWEAIHRMGRGKSEIVCVMGVSKRN